MEVIVFLPALSLATLNSVRKLLEEYLEQYFQIKTSVHSVSTERGRGLSFNGSSELAFFWEREFDNLALHDGRLYLSQSPLDELLLQERNIDYSLFNWAIFVEEIPELETDRENKIKEGWRILQTCFSPTTDKFDNSFPEFFKHIVATDVIRLRTGFAVKVEAPIKFPELSLTVNYQDFIRQK